MKVKLEEVCKRIYAGGDVPKDRYSEVKTKKYSIPIYANAEKDNGLYGYTDKAREEELSITVAARGTIGFTAIRREPFLPVVRLITVVPDTEKVSERYLYYVLKNCKPQSSGTSIPQLTVPDIKKNRLELYDISEQERIADQVDKVSKVIELRKQELEALDNLIKARFVEMFGNPQDNPFGWEKVPLSKVILNANNGMARRGNDENGNIVMRLVELQDGYIDYSNPNRIVLKEDEKTRYLLRDKDFLFARVNGNPNNVGRCAVFEDIGEDVYHNDHIIRVHFNELLLDGTFASALLNSDYGKRQLKGQIKTSAGQYTVSQDGIGAIVTILPPMPIQKEFADFVHQIDKSKVVYQGYSQYIA